MKELLLDLGNSLLTSAAVTQGVLDLDDVGLSAISELDLDSVGNAALSRVQVADRVGLVLSDFHLLSQGVNSGVLGEVILVVVSGQVAKDETNGSHVLQAVIAISGVDERTLLVDDANSGLVGLNVDLLDLVQARSNLRVQLDGTFDSGLSMEFSREGDLEQNVLHDVLLEGALELERLTLEQHVRETPLGSGESSLVAHFALQGHQGQTNTTGSSITSSPRFARTSVGEVSVGSQTVTIDPALADSVQDSLAITTKETSRDRGRSQLDEQDVIQTNSVETVFQSQATLDFVGLDQTVKNVLHGQRSLAFSNALVGDVFADSKNSTQVVRRVTPLSGQPSVIEVQPTDDSANVESTLNRVQDELSSRDVNSVRNDGARDNGTQVLGALGELQSEHTTT